MRIVEKVKNTVGNYIDLESLVDEYYSRQKWQHWAFKKVRDNLNKYLITLPSASKEREFANVLYNGFPDLIKATPSKQAVFIRYFKRKGYQKLVHNGITRLPFGNQLEKVFDYKGFRKSTKGSWYANCLNVNACLYCNAQYTLIVKKNNRDKVLFQFDHFFSKTLYPYLSISMYNIVPSCSNCNKLKSDTEFTLLNAVHPFVEDMNKYLEFDLNEKDFLNYFLNGSNIDKIKILLKKRKNVPIGGIEEKKIKFHKKIFALDTVYQHFKDVAEELLLKKYYYNDSRKDELEKMSIAGYHLFTKQMLNRFILGNYSLDSEINKRTLAKMMKDIGEKLKLIK